MGEWGWLALVGGTITIVTFAIIAFATRRPVTATRLASTDAGDSHPDLLLGDMTEALSRGIPGEARDKEEILPVLVRAGKYSPNALSEYRAIRTVLVLLPMLIAAGICVLVEERYIPYVALGGVGVAILGFTLPRVYISIKAASRSREIERGLPVFADMMSIALLAGQGLTGAMRRVTDQLRTSFPRFTDELEIVIRQTDMLSLNVAFEQWANRCQLSDVRNLAVILTQSQRLGNDVSTALMEYATNLRVNARQRADARAQRASFWMLFPTILCLWIPAIVILVGPLYFEFAERARRGRESMPNYEQIRNVGPNQLKELKIGAANQ